MAATASLHLLSRLRFIANPQPLPPPHSLPFHFSLSPKTKVPNYRFFFDKTLIPSCLFCQHSFFFLRRNRVDSGCSQWLRNRRSRRLTTPVSIQLQTKPLRDTLCNKLWAFFSIHILQTHLLLSLFAWFWIFKLYFYNCRCLESKTPKSALIFILAFWACRKWFY